MKAFVARIVAAAAFALLGTTFAPNASAQCFGPDKLDGGACCSVATINAPRCPNFSQDSLQICWNNCNIDAINTCTAVWSSPTPNEDCRNYSKRLRLKDAANVVKWNGRIKFRYSRTWEETDTTGSRRQIWRYLTNGDLRPTAAAGAAPCPVPPCTAPNGNKVRFTGYVDYAVDCTGGLREFAWMLNHDCDTIDHAPGFARAGAFHPNRSYTYVGPAAGFVVSPLQPVEAGGGFFEAVRRISRAAGSTIDMCDFEERAQHSLTPNTSFCLCFTGSPSNQYTFSDLVISGNCGTTATSGGPFIPDYLTKGIGSWTIPGVFPGLENLRWNCSGMVYFDPCSSTTRNEVFFGVTTLGGWPATQLSSGPGVITLPPIFIDQGNSLQGGLGTTMNRPYRSDHILNLNY
jgi:hypothetical protein